MYAPSTLLLAFTLLTLCACGSDPMPDGIKSVENVKAYFDRQEKTVLTFVGYSGAGYEDESAMLAAARATLEDHDAATTIVNIGATPDGIGAIYALAKELGFTTTGIVSTQAREHDASISPHVDRVFFVEDATWGGLLEGGGELAPTSEAMVSVSDIMVGIGGGAVGRDELDAARKRGKPVKFVPADLNHKRAIEKASKKGLPEPTDFRGDAHRSFADVPGR